LKILYWQYFLNVNISNGKSIVKVTTVVTVLSFFFAGRVFSPVLRPYMIGPMRSPDIQNLLEAFASLKRGLQCSKARSSYSSSESVEFQDAG